MTRLGPDGVMRAENGAPLLDNDGEPITELQLDQVDALAEQLAAVADLAARQRAWRYGHVIVDEAQDLTPMQWRMVVRRARNRSMTIVGDLAQRSVGPPGSWDDHLPDTLDDAARRELTVNYRSPAEVTEVATRLLADLAPALRPSTAIRSSGEPVAAVALDDDPGALAGLVSAELDAVGDGRLAVIGWDLPAEISSPEVTVLDPDRAKGLEFDVVIVVEPADILDRDHGLSRLYVAITRTTRRLVLAHRRPLPEVLSS